MNSAMRFGHLRFSENAKPQLINWIGFTIIEPS